MKKKAPLMKQTNLYVEIGRRYQELLQIKQVKENAIENAPPGKIHIIQIKNSVQYYLRKNSDEKTGEYIPKSNVSKLKSYLQKSYDEKLLKLINQEIDVLEKFLRKSNCFSEGKAQIHEIHFGEGKVSSLLSQPIISIQQIYSSYPEEAKKYINPVAMSDEDYAKYWLGIPYNGKEISEYATCYETNRKEKVRSKSELNIANALAARGIPYKYECPLTLKNGITIYPDFTILNVKERKVIYWEHRGMMDDKEYAKKYF